MSILVSTDEWLNELRTRLPGISGGQLDLELKATLREFFTESGFWMEEPSPINIVANKDTYKITYPQAKVMGVHRVWVDGLPIALSTTLPKTENPGSGARQAYMLEHDLMQLFPTPDKDIQDGLKVLVRLNPSQSMTKVPSETVSHFFDYVLDGVLGRLYSQPGKPYTNLTQGVYHLRRFRNGISLARDIGRKRYGNATRPWQFPQGWM